MERVTVKEVATTNDSRVNVLIVDDTPQIGALLCLLVKELGFNGVTCQSPVEARYLLLEQQWNLVITDIHMPYEDGFDLLHWVKAHFPQLPMLAMTFDSSSKISQRISAAGFANTLYKPFSIHQFYEVTHNIMLTD